MNSETVYQLWKNIRWGLTIGLLVYIALKIS